MSRKRNVPIEQLSTLVSLDWNLQRARMPLVQQIAALKLKGADTTALEAEILAPLLELEKFSESQLKGSVENVPLWGFWLKHVGGIGEKLTAQLVYLIKGQVHDEECQEKRDKYYSKKKPGEKRAPTFLCDCPVKDIERFHSVSALWKYAGLNVEKFCRDCDKTIEDASLVCPHCGSTNLGGRAPKRRRGQKITWNPRLRMVCFNIGKSFVRVTKGPYRAFYDEYKAFYNAKYPDRSAGHRDAMARRKTVKLFLSHLFEMWHRMKGLEPPKPYILEHGGHVHRIPPPESGQTTETQT